jgi:hypothetical protein
MKFPIRSALKRLSRVCQLMTKSMRSTGGLLVRVVKDTGRVLEDVGDK